MTPLKKLHVATERIKQVRYTRHGVAFLLLLVVGCWFLTQGHSASTPDQKIEENNEERADILALGGSQPTRLIIPKLNIDTTFETPLGLQTSGEIEVPDGYEEVGWYKYSPTPGEFGPSIILGHVDSVDGPAVFYSLGQLESGDVIEIEREDGMIAPFRVTKLERYEQSGFPRELVYGNIDHAGLRLITCSGSFDHGEQRYSHNLVVYGELVDSL